MCGSAGIVRADAGQQEGHDADCDDRDGQSVQNGMCVAGLESDRTYDEADQHGKDLLAARDEELGAHGRQTGAGRHDLDLLRDDAAVQEGVGDTAQDRCRVGDAHAGGEGQAQEESRVADRTDQGADLSAEFIGHGAREGQGDETAEAECCGNHGDNTDVGRDIRISPLGDQDFLDGLLAQDGRADSVNEVGQVHHERSRIVFRFRLCLHFQYSPL